MGMAYVGHMALSVWAGSGQAAAGGQAKIARSALLACQYQK